MKKYVVRLEADERVALEQIVRTGTRAALTIRHANILLAVDESDAGPRLSDVQAAQAFGVAVRSIESLRKRLVEEGLESALRRKPQVRPSVERMFDGEKEAKLIAIACSSKPEGRTRWTLELLAERVVRLKIVEKCSPKTIGRVLQKTS
jgi:transposase